MDKHPPRETFLESIDRALDTFGTTVRAVVYYELKKSFGLSREDIPRKPEMFVKTIEKIFGLGSRVVEGAIRKELEKSFGIKDLGEHDLTTAIRTAYHKHLEE